jgi:hypothetical protein
MDETRNCHRNPLHVIAPGELYRMVSAKRFCGPCAEQVFGPDWAKAKFADICRDGYQVPWSERKDG